MAWRGGVAAGVARWVLAFALPVAIVLGSMAGMEKYRNFADNREDKNAGKVINGRVVNVGVAAMIEHRLDKYEPEIVILGNSLSNTDLNVNLLSENLGLPPNKIQRFSIPNSMAAHWYAIIKNRVYANGHTPRIVLILSDLQSLLALSPRSEASHLNLSVQLGESEPVIDAKLGHRFYWYERVRENRGKLRDMALMGVRNLMVDLLVHHTFASTDPKAIEQSLGKVFDSSHTDMRLHNNVIPIYNSENDKDLLPFDPTTLPMPVDSFLGEMVKLVDQNEGHLVYLRPPMSPAMPDGVGDIVLPAQEDAVYPLMGEHHGLYLDLREVQMDQTHFHNIDHMNPEGARRFTQIVAELLQDVHGASRGAAELLKTVAVADGRYTALPVEAAFHQRPPALPREDRTFAKGRGRLLFFPTDSLGFLADTTTGLVSPHATRCSPLRVLEDGVPLPLPNEACDDVQKKGMGRTCHAPDKLFFTTSDGSNPYLTERDYRFVLDPKRECDGGLWLYPGDQARINARPFDLGSLNHGGSRLTVRGVDLGATQIRELNPRVEIRIRAGNQVRGDATVSVHDLTTTGVLLALEPRIAATAQNVQVELVNDSDQYILLTSVRIDGG